LSGRTSIVRHRAGRVLSRAPELAVVERPRRILVVQCGEGIVLAIRVARPPDSRLDGLELEEAAPVGTRMRGSDATLGRGDACGLPFGNRSFRLEVRRLAPPLRAGRTGLTAWHSLSFSPSGSRSAPGA